MSKCHDNCECGCAFEEFAQYSADGLPPDGVILSRFVLPQEPLHVKVLPDPLPPFHVHPFSGRLTVSEPAMQSIRPKAQCCETFGEPKTRNRMLAINYVPLEKSWWIQERYRGRKKVPARAKKQMRRLMRAEFPPVTFDVEMEKILTLAQRYRHPNPQAILQGG